MPMPGRFYSIDPSKTYRYGMNGQENSSEIFEGATTAEYWEYDSRLGRRWNLDPIVKPWESGYATFGNNPIYYSDPNGLDKKPKDEKPKGKKQKLEGGEIPQGNFTIKQPKRKAPERPQTVSAEHMESIPLTSVPTTGATPIPEIATPAATLDQIPTVNMAGLIERNNTDLFSKFGVPRNNPLFYNLAPVWKNQEYMNWVNFNQGSGSLSYGILTVSADNNGSKFGGSAGIFSVDEDGNWGASHGYASVAKNSWDITIASWEVKYDAFKTINGSTKVGPLLSVPTSTTIYRVTYINTTVLMFGSRRIIVDASTQFMQGQPYMWQTLKDTTTDFKRFGGTLGGVSADMKTD